MGGWRYVGDDQCSNLSIDLSTIFTRAKLKVIFDS